MKEIEITEPEVLTREQRAFLEQLSAFNAQSVVLRAKGAMSPAMKVQRRARAAQMARRAKALFPGMKVEVS